MNHHQRHTPPGAKWILHCFALLLAAVLSSPKAVGTLLPNFSGPPTKVTRRGYLSAVGAPELRFQERVSPAVRPAAKPPTAFAKAEEPAATTQAAAPMDASVTAPERSTTADL